MKQTSTTAVVEVSGLYRGSSKAVVEAALSRRPGVRAVEANPVAQTATVTYDPAVTTLESLTGWIRDCGCHCAGRSVPDHVCDPMEEPPGAEGPASELQGEPPSAHQHDMGGHQGAVRAPQDVMGHGGHHAEDVHAVGIEPALLTRLAQGGVDRSAIAALGRSTGEDQLPGVLGQVGRALRQQDRRPGGSIDEQGQDSGRSQGHSRGHDAPA